MMSMSREKLFARLVKAGELEVNGGSDEETASYFDVPNFKFDGPGDFKSDYAGLQDYFASLRAAFDDRSIERGEPVIDGNRIACQTWIRGRFVNEFTMSPVGKLPPNGRVVTFDLSNIYRFDEQGRIVEEIVRTDNRSVLEQLGAKGR